MSSKRLTTRLLGQEEFREATLYTERLSEVLKHSTQSYSPRYRTWNPPCFFVGPTLLLARPENHDKRFSLPDAQEHSCSVTSLYLAQFSGSPNLTSRDVAKLRISYKRSETWIEVFHFWWHVKRQKNEFSYKVLRQILTQHHNIMKESESEELMQRD